MHGAWLKREPGGSPMFYAIPPEAAAISSRLMGIGRICGTFHHLANDDAVTRLFHLD